MRAAEDLVQKARSRFESRINKNPRPSGARPLRRRARPAGIVTNTHKRAGSCADMRTRSKTKTPRAECLTLEALGEDLLSECVPSESKRNLLGYSLDGSLSPYLLSPLFLSPGATL